MIRKIFLSVLITVLVATIGYASVAYNAAEPKLTKVTFENCTPYSWVGGVRWIWGENGKGVYAGATYEDVPELELKEAGSLVVYLAPGDYAITHYMPRSVHTRGNKIIIAPAKIIEFREVTVEDEPIIFSFGCVE